MTGGDKSPPAEITPLEAQAPPAPDPDAIAERAAVIEFDGGIPRRWADALARLCVTPCPEGFPERHWQRALDDAGKLLDRHAADLDRYGWHLEDVFGLDAIAPWARLDRMGLVYLIAGRSVTSVTADHATLHTRRGEQTRFYRPCIDDHRRAWRSPGPLPW